MIVVAFSSQVTNVEVWMALDVIEPGISEHKTTNTTLIKRLSTRSMSTRRFTHWRWSVKLCQLAWTIYNNFLARINWVTFCSVLKCSFAVQESLVHCLPTPTMFLQIIKCISICSNQFFLFYLYPNYGYFENLLIQTGNNLI